MTRDLGRLLILLGGVLLLLGIALTAFGGLGLGRLPDDFVYRRGTFTFYFPLMTSILLSVALSLLLWLFRR
jgi:multisubunit Na+/H+ antiporter MnhG subunit